MDTKLHFLVVNESPLIQQVIVSLLKEIGYIKVSEAMDGKMALRALKSAAAVGNPVNFVITDSAMPFMNGLELIRAIRDAPEMKDVPILMVTEEATKDDVIAAQQAGADAYIVRPFRAANLRNKVQSLLISKGLKEAEVSLKSFRPFLRTKTDADES
ncbi:response regulator [Undibacterium sp.]|uniref:response regulator n=1 Tax=Undibacterium sp. TaxID=1914977 RepID=UPI002C4CFE67|nr:response regulator [Undibacterium sp.]HTD05913.1 response regulator [Undibacterium sp.]